MWPFSLFNRKKKIGLYPESLWQLRVEDDVIFGADHTGASMSVCLGDLRTVAIETNDSGPWGADVYWLLFGSDAKLALAFPQGATGEKEVVAKLMALPGFDHNKMIEAMGCTDNSVFLVWEKSENQFP